MYWHQQQNESECEQSKKSNLGVQILPNYVCLIVDSGKEGKLGTQAQTHGN